MQPIHKILLQVTWRDSRLIQWSIDLPRRIPMEILIQVHIWIQWIFKKIIPIIQMMSNRKKNHLLNHLLSTKRLRFKQKLLYLPLSVDPCMYTHRKLHNNICIRKRMMISNIAKLALRLWCSNFFVRGLLDWRIPRVRLRGVLVFGTPGWSPSCMVARGSSTTRMMHMRNLMEIFCISLDCSSVIFHSCRSPRERMFGFCSRPHQLWITSIWTIFAWWWSGDRWDTLHDTVIIFSELIDPFVLNIIQIVYIFFRVVSFDLLGITFIAMNHFSASLRIRYGTTLFKWFESVV